MDTENHCLHNRVNTQRKFTYLLYITMLEAKLSVCCNSHCDLHFKLNCPQVLAFEFCELMIEVLLVQIYKSSIY